MDTHKFRIIILCVLIYAFCGLVAFFAFRLVTGNKGKFVIEEGDSDRDCAWLIGWPILLCAHAVTAFIKKFKLNPNA